MIDNSNTVMPDNFNTLAEAKDALRKSEKALERALERERAADSNTDSRILEAAHDIRANLSPLIGYSEILKGEFFGPLENEKYSECAEVLYTSSTRLFDLCNSILNTFETKDYDQQGEGNIILVNATETINEVAGLFKEIATQRNINLSTKISPNFPHLNLPPQHLYRALSNLVSNAVKFTPSGGKVSIEANVDANEDALIMVIRNTGPGIPADQIMRILKPNQSEESLYVEKGSGLGLPIVNKLMREVGGVLDIKSNGTTTITLKFPK
jgi:two-component system, cell cycle sensor histidine kinase PleC